METLEKQGRQEELGTGAGAITGETSHLIGDPHGKGSARARQGLGRFNP